jgi:hypothetical protein
LKGVPQTDGVPAMNFVEMADGMGVAGTMAKTAEQFHEQCLR